MHEFPMIHDGTNFCGPFGLPNRLLFDVLPICLSRDPKLANATIGDPFPFTGNGYPEYHADIQLHRGNLKLQ